MRAGDVGAAVCAAGAGDCRERGDEEADRHLRQDLAHVASRPGGPAAFRYDLLQTPAHT